MAQLSLQCVQFGHLFSGLWLLLATSLDILKYTFHNAESVPETGPGGHRGPKKLGGKGEGKVIPVVIRGKREVEIIPVTTLSPPEHVTLTLTGSGVSRFNVSFIVGEQSQSHRVHSSSVLLYVHRDRTDYSIRDGEPRTANSTFTPQLLGSDR